MRNAPSNASPSAGVDELVVVGVVGVRGVVDRGDDIERVRWDVRRSIANERSIDRSSDAREGGGRDVS